MSNWETMVKDICEEKADELNKPIIPSIADIDGKAMHEFPTGAKRDIQDGKGRCDLLPLDILACMMGEEEPDSYILEINKFLQDESIMRLLDILKDFMKETYGSVYEGFLELSIHFEEGAKKYGVNNWKIGIPMRSYISSAVRHRIKMLREDTDERHDRAFMWNIICAIWTYRNMPEMNDI